MKSKLNDMLRMSSKLMDFKLQYGTSFHYSIYLNEECEICSDMDQISQPQRKSAVAGANRDIRPFRKGTL